MREGYQGRLLTCADSGGQFTRDARAQAYFRATNLQPPKRCEACHQAWKERRVEACTKKNGE